jgi:hypothetical protein
MQSSFREKALALEMNWMLAPVEKHLLGFNVALMGNARKHRQVDLGEPTWRNWQTR